MFDGEWRIRWRKIEGRKSFSSIAPLRLSGRLPPLLLLLRPFSLASLFARFGEAGMMFGEWKEGGKGRGGSLKTSQTRHISIAEKWRRGGGEESSNICRGAEKGREGGNGADERGWREGVGKKFC